MKILIIGSGGREHALAWKISQSPRVNKIYCAPGNAGTESLAENLPILATDIQELKRFAFKEKIDLTVVGPELPLTNGIVDEFEQNNLKCFGPYQIAAELEGSKVFAKQFMERHIQVNSLFLLS
jgi:phosphoribosylamine--glycine ligase